ncbi:unnamed protein product, partial [Coccothraustes coccothraustes]
MGTAGCAAGGELRSWRSGQSELRAEVGSDLQGVGSLAVELSRSVLLSSAGTRSKCRCEGCVMVK